MQYSFRLAELLGHVPDPRKRPGTIKSIVEYTGLDRHQVAALLKNEVKYVPMKALSRLCEYLVEHGHATADQLPGALFSVEPEHFWELLARRHRVELCLGVRQAEDEAWPAWVVVADSLLMGSVLNGVSTLGGTAKHRPERIHPEHLNQILVWSPGQHDDTEVFARARDAYTEYSQRGSDKALVCLGSTKSNPVVELVVADAFGCEPFRSQDGLAASMERTVPFYIRYRDEDPHPESCWGGINLGADVDSSRPGIYYETDSGDWECCESDSSTDVAFVFYLHRESQGRLDMAIGGFSGRATRLLARALNTRADGFWPPIHNAHGVQVGAFVARFKLTQDENEYDALSTDIRANTTIIPLAESVIERRLSKRQRAGDPFEDQPLEAE